MKTISLGLRRFAKVALFTLALAGQAGVADDGMAALFQQGRALFFQGKFAEAKPLLEQVAVANPRHVETQAMLARIKIMEKEAPPLTQRYAAIVLPKVEFDDVSLAEALEGLKLLSKEATGGKVVPNFVVRGETDVSKRVSLSLSNIPLTDALQYVAQLTGSTHRFDASAVVFSPAGAP